MERINQEGEQERPLWSQYARSSARREDTSSARVEEGQTESSSGSWQMGSNCKGVASEHLAKHRDGLAIIG